MQSSRLTNKSKKFKNHVKDLNNQLKYNKNAFVATKNIAKKIPTTL